MPHHDVSSVVQYQVRTVNAVGGDGESGGAADAPTIPPREVAAGAPVLALHGAGSTGRQWRGLRSRLKGRFRLVMPDLPSYGRSPRLAGPEGLAAEAAAVAALIARIGAPVHLVGHSWGGAVALKLAHGAPRLLRSLTLIEPAAFHLLRGCEPMLYAEVEAVGDAMITRIAEGDPAGAMAVCVDYWHGPGAWHRSSAEFRSKLRSMAAQVAANFAAVAAERGRLESLADLRVPTLMVMGGTSPRPAGRLTEMLAEAIPGAGLCVIPGASHAAPLTHPRQVNPVIARHLLAAEAGAADHAPRAAA